MGSAALRRWQRGGETSGRDVRPAAHWLWPLRGGDCVCMEPSDNGSLDNKTREDVCVRARGVGLASE